MIEQLLNKFQEKETMRTLHTLLLKQLSRE